LPGIRNRPQSKTNLIIFTDLDGTLLDSEYSFTEAIPALNIIHENDIPLILCSSKTKAEIAHCRKILNNTHPFISENGGGIFIHEKYFQFRIQVVIDSYRGAGFRVQKEENVYVIKLGADYSDLRNALHDLRSEGFDVTGFGDMSIKEVSDLTGLKPADASRAKQRFFDEPFVFRGAASDVEKMKKTISDKGLNYTQGEFFHIMGNSDKGRAVEVLKGLYSKQRGEIITIALGDSVNDIAMLERADYPVVIQKQDGSYNSEVIQQVKGCIKAGGIGPDGWNRSVLKLLHQFGIE
jgi:mannosyl-3-phosphoglycerate phosphatase family protein